MNKEIKIPYSHFKVFLTLVISLSFLLFGIAILLDEHGMTTTIFRSEIVNKTFAIFAILFFGTLIIKLPQKLFDRRNGLEVTEYGIIDYSTLSGVGLIEWKDIKRIRKQKGFNSNLLLVDTSDPLKYIDKADCGIKRWLMKCNYKKFHTPIKIKSSSLKVSFKELEKIVYDAYQNSKEV
ncbi:MAG: hypothetical protein N4A37_11775 [Prolixibacteraceae bacterium]|jgi:hypothetical protein|nr:hypothetical protein [Prolixibacteraceae bacterium]